MKYFLLCLLILTFSIYSEEEGFIPVNIKEKIFQGEISLKQANEFLGDRKYFSCIEKIKEFQILYHDHPSFLKSYKILSLAYKKIQKWDLVAETEMNLFNESPETEEGMNAYLNVAKAFVRIGKIEEAKKIFEEIISKENTSKLKKEAELELNLLNAI
ncbi:MAG: hypothetical protein L6Q54_07265 [Leptospiraceae bacterium]|nr:hypothetical protein [Leptospiraceae bacterium]MCK6381035.1 hypothetical protein [Leptospiraceae bacterium]